MLNLTNEMNHLMLTVGVGQPYEKKYPVLGTGGLQSLYRGSKQYSESYGRTQDPIPVRARHRARRSADSVFLRWFLARTKRPPRHVLELMAASRPCQ